jgi:hypothetical protein
LYHEPQKTGQKVPDVIVDPRVGNNIIIAIDSIGIKVAKCGEWMREMES